MVYLDLVTTDFMVQVSVGLYFIIILFKRSIFPVILTEKRRPISQNKSLRKFYNQHVSHNLLRMVRSTCA